MECLAAAGAVCGARRDTTGDKVSDGESYGEWYRSGIACTSISRAFDGAEKVICFVDDGEPTHCCRGRRLPRSEGGQGAVYPGVKGARAPFTQE